MWHVGLSNATMANVNVLSEMINIKNGIKICKILYDHDINSIIMNVTTF